MLVLLVKLRIFSYCYSQPSPPAADSLPIHASWEKVCCSRRQHYRHRCWLPDIDLTYCLIYHCSALETGLVKKARDVLNFHAFGTEPGRGVSQVIWPPIISGKRCQTVYDNLTCGCAFSRKMCHPYFAGLQQAPYYSCLVRLHECNYGSRNVGRKSQSWHVETSVHNAFPTDGKSRERDRPACRRAGVPARRLARI